MSKEELDIMEHNNHTSVSDRLREEALDFALFEQAKIFVFDYMRNILDQDVFPDERILDGLNNFKEPLQEEAGNPYEILDRLHNYGSPATVAQTGGRYFGFVNGGIVPAALAAKWLSDTWDQNAALYVISPIASVLEEVCEKWLVDLFNFPENTAAGFVGGSSTATLCGLAAGRNHLLHKLGYDVSTKGLFGAPEFRVILGEGAHSTVYKALSILGLGSERLIKIPTDEQGRILVDSVPELDDRTLLILQAGNVNSGAFDDFETLCQKAGNAGSWVHVDGAFGLWAATSDNLRHLTKGVELADSWSVDAHKTLNAPYDNVLQVEFHPFVWQKGSRKNDFPSVFSSCLDIFHPCDQADGIKVFTPFSRDHIDVPFGEGIVTLQPVCPCLFLAF